ncbi:MAG: hypothetical protein Ta2D_06310 [Rickettsiales bacterium]|nr:MAG: hypothetical protein Ta2D_06310 [Rickettsiales bacterium]
MKKLLLLLLQISLVYAGDLPDWVNNKDKECSKNEICAVGNGGTPNEAKRDARANILKYFESNVNSKYSNEINESSDGVKEKSSFNIEEAAEGLLNGVDIKKTHDAGKEVYAFAVLDKTQASKILRNDIDKLDTKMKLLLDEKGKVNYAQLEKLYNKRDSLNKKYIFLNNSGIEEVVRYEDVFKQKSGLANIGYYLRITGSNVNGLKNNLKSAITKSGGKITDNLATAQRVINGTVEEREEYMKVDGFVKYTIEYNLETKTRDGVSQGTITQEYTETGRDLKQILRIADDKFKEYLDENAWELLQ